MNREQGTSNNFFGKIKNIPRSPYFAGITDQFLILEVLVHPVIYILKKKCRNELSLSSKIDLNLSEFCN